jgi:hypothetical protein
MKKNVPELLVTIPLIVFGILMLLFAKPEIREGWHRADTYFLESIWSPEAGITFLVLGLVFLSLLLKNWNKPTPKKPSIPSAAFYKISFFIVKISSLVYAILLLQYALGSFKIISMNYSYDDESMSAIHMVCIMFIVIFGIIALITGLVSRSARKANKEID